MKRFFLILMSLLLCLSLCACGKKSKKDDDDEGSGSSAYGSQIIGDVHASPKNAALSAFKSRYIDYDNEAYFKINVTLSLDLIDSFLQGEDAESYKAAVENKRKENTISVSGKNESTKEGSVIAVDEYISSSNKFKSAMSRFPYQDPAITKAVTKYAKVHVLVTEPYEENGETITEHRVRTYDCYCIGGKWYVD